MKAGGWGFTYGPWLGKSETVGPCRGADSRAHFGALQFCDGVVKFHKTMF